MDWEVRQIEKWYLTQKDPKSLYQNVKNMTPAELREIFKTNFIPKAKTHDDLTKEIKYKKVWREPGYCNKEFMPIAPLKGQVLEYWEQSRVNMPVRSYERYPVAKQLKNCLVGKEFGYDENAKGTTEQYRKYLTDHNEKFKEFQYHPSYYNKPDKFLPSILLDKKPFYVKKSSYGEFNFPKHNAFLYENRFRAKK